jgi:hypothetical protein
VKSDFGESMIWRTGAGGTGVGSPQRRRSCPWTGAGGLKISRARQKPNSFLFFAPISRIVESINIQGKV